MHSAFCGLKCFDIFITHSLEDGFVRAQFSKHGGEYRELRNVSISFYFTIIEYRVGGTIVYNIGVIVNRIWLGLRVVGYNDEVRCMDVLDMWSSFSCCVVRWMKY